MRRKMRFLRVVERGLLLYKIGCARKPYNEPAHKKYVQAACRIMSSIGAKITAAILRLYTYSYRKNHKSLSRSFRFKYKPYRPPKTFGYEVIRVCGTDIEILRPFKPDCRYAIVHFHGGGHTQPMNSMYRKVAERLCKISGCAVYSIDYKTADGLVYPSVHNECFSAYVGLREGLLKGLRVIAVGDSFGANLMLSACLRLRDNGLSLPCAIISVSCYIDLAASGKSYEDNCYKDPLYALPKNQKYEENQAFIRRITPYCGQTSPYNEYLSPAYADYEGFPYMLIQCGQSETSSSDSDMLYERAVNAGVNAKLTKYKDMWHDFQYLTPFLKESKTAWDEIGKFISDIVEP